MRLHGIDLDPERLGSHLRKAGVVRAWLFGSILTDRFGPESDIDLLVETDPARPPGLFALAGLQADLSDLLGRSVHLTLLGGVPSEEQPDLVATARRLDAA